MSRDKVDVDTFHKDIQYALEELGKSKFGFERTAVTNFKSKRRHEGSGNELGGGGGGGSKEKRKKGEREEVNKVNISFLPIKHTSMHGTE